MNRYERGYLSRTFRPSIFHYDDVLSPFCASNAISLPLLVATAGEPSSRGMIAAACPATPTRISPKSPQRTRKMLARLPETIRRCCCATFEVSEYCVLTVTQKHVPIYLRMLYDALRQSGTMCHLVLCS
jgi:hypothetical protein